MNEFYLWCSEDEATGVEPTRHASLEDAIASLPQRQLEFLPDGKQPPRFEIFRAPPGATFQPAKKARYDFYFDAKENASGGDGSEASCWSGLASTVEELTRLHGEGALKLKTGERLRLTHREIFTATSLETRKDFQEKVAKVFFGIVVAAMVLPVLAIIGYLFYRAWPVLSPEFFFTNPTDNMTAGGIWAPLVGTFYLAIVSLLIDAPIGILAAIYLNEYAPDNWLTRAINLAVVNLAGVPSIVHGLFGFGAFVLFADMGASVLAASCTLAVMSLPVIITSTREALASVPMSFREACWNMGASRWQTIRTIVLPNSLSGILTGVIFEICRTAGETAPILFTGVVFFMEVPETGLSSFFPYGLGDSCMALQYHLFTLATQVRGVSEEIQFGTAAVLISLTLVINSISISMRIYLRSHKRW